MVLASGGCPWKTHLYELERKHMAPPQRGESYRRWLRRLAPTGVSLTVAILVTQVTPLVKFVLYTDQAGMWRVQAVTQEGTAFTNRLGLLEAPTRVRRLLVEIPMTGPRAPERT